MPALSSSTTFSSSLLILLFLIFSLLLLPHPALPTTVLADDKAIAGEMQSPALTGQIFKESSSPMNLRMELHEVEAGANPISNSLTVSWPANP